MGRVTIILALWVFPALIGCSKPDESDVRLVKAHASGDCHLALNGVRIPDNVLLAEGKKHRGDRAVASDKFYTCQGALIRLQKAGVNIQELPRLDLRH
jgi:hypothetical protein